MEICNGPEVIDVFHSKVRIIRLSYGRVAEDSISLTRQSAKDQTAYALTWLY